MQVSKHPAMFRINEALHIDLICEHKYKCIGPAAFTVFKTNNRQTCAALLNLQPILTNTPKKCNV